MRPIRVALFAPGINARVMEKALGADTDAVILDLEDTVPPPAKDQARALVGSAIDSHQRQRGQSGPYIFVRVNSAATGHLVDDLKATVRPGLAAVLLPKVETTEEVREAAAVIEQHEAAQGMQAGIVSLLLQIESALGVHHCFDLIKASARIGGTCFGSARDGDLQKDLGCSWSIEGTELLYARSKVLLETRAAGGSLVPLDGVFSDLGDENGLLQDSRLSARLGYLGRTAIHPKQIAPIRQAYAVSTNELATYEKIIAEFESAERQGLASITVDNRLVDYAMYEQAKRVIALAQLDRL